MENGPPQDKQINTHNTDELSHLVDELSLLWLLECYTLGQS